MATYDYFDLAGQIIQTGDRIELRDFSRVIPAEDCSLVRQDGKWQLAPYLLINRTPGVMIATNYRSEAEARLPRAFTIPLAIRGRYLISFCVPVMDIRPKLTFPSGVDISLDGAPFLHIGPETGVRRARHLVETNREIWCNYREALLDHSTLTIRVTYGACSSMVKGLVRAILAGIRFTRLPDEPAVQTEQEPVKPVLIVVDGFSHYFTGGVPGSCIDTRLAEAYRDSDIQIIMLQTPCTGITSWRSKVTNYLGEDYTPAMDQSLRFGDVRAMKYMDWTIRQDQEVFRVLGEQCRRSGIRFHGSLRANLFFENNSKFTRDAVHFLNGRFWQAHPELLKIPGENGKPQHQLDYAQPAVRRFLMDILGEMLDRYDLDGFNLDLTRWPPILDPLHHDLDLLPDFLRTIRTRLDQAAQRRGHPLAFSISVVDQYHANMSLIDQRIDLERILAAKVLDFICVEAYDNLPYIQLAHQYGTRFFAIQDGNPIWHPQGFRGDSLCRLADGSMQDDPVPGEEMLEQPPLNSNIRPEEFNIAFDRHYARGADGACIVNNFNGNLTFRRLGHVAETRQRAMTGEIFGQQYGEYLFLTNQAQ